MGKPSLVHEPTRNEAIALRFQQLTEETTLHGLPQLKRSNSRIKRTLWVLIMVVVGVIMCSHIAILVMSFVEKEINVEIKIKSARELPFPAVTIYDNETSTTTTEPDTTNIEQEAPPGAKIDYSVMNNE
ncbi:hypothetical protein LSH36_707g01128 [Paralvinella palmiformis]|uniref:Uncharacterized protein n=1 Tax=Paralvinella palmiformis TaxID=53620 RepID=A0AAD9MVZ9_9ANNE|nr:hypothetical protein LSH36_707g01128 [Paralvinella palmiformis]